MRKTAATLTLFLQFTASILPLLSINIIIFGLSFGMMAFEIVGSEVVLWGLLLEPWNRRSQFQIHNLVAY